MEQSNPSYITYFNWSTGKDSALALYRLLQNPEYSVGYLLTSVNSAYNRVSMHGLRREIMEQQIASLGIPAMTVELPESPDMETYAVKMREAVHALQEKGFQHTAFGDIFLEDLREYREKQLAEMGISAHFPLWKIDTRELILEFIDLGFKSVVICVNASKLDESFLGRTIDRDFLDDLPDDVDPCGENGEFHTFCYDGPVFRHPISFKEGERILRNYPNPDKSDGQEDLGFWYLDLLPEER